MESKNILILSHKPPYPKVDGGSVAIAQLLEILIDQNHSVTFIGMETDKNPAQKKINHKNLKYNTVYTNTKISLWGAFKNLFHQKSYILSRFHSQTFEKKLQDTLKEKRFDLIIFESLFTSSYLKSVLELTKTKIIYRCHNIEHLIWKTKIEHTKNYFLKNYLNLQANRLKKEELTFWNTNITIAPISEFDKDIISQNTISKIELLNLFLEDRHMIDSNFSTKKDFFHIGSMDWQPNLDGVKWFIDNVWSEIHAEDDSLEFHIAGKEMPKKNFYKYSEGLINHNYVENAIEFISEHNIMIVPLFSGSGMRVKIIEGMALGKCIISTSLGAQGIPYENEKNILIANTKEEFIKVIRLCTLSPNKAMEIGQEAKKLVKEKFSKSNTINQLLKLFK